VVSIAISIGSGGSEGDSASVAITGIVDSGDGGTGGCVASLGVLRSSVGTLRLNDYFQLPEKSNITLCGFCLDLIIFAPIGGNQRRSKSTICHHLILEITAIHARKLFT